ncbi:30S ribosomal protein S20 [bacterium DOLZORAL124_38_8]|nr:MAG: 30S ribosomal protein S20 [bacterium DOLZORAL124_38_8]
MPIIKSAIKRVRQTKRKTLRNATVKRLTKEVIKKFLTHVENGEKKEAIALFPTVQKRIDLMSKKNLWHAHKSARKVSAYAKLISDKK